MLRNCASGLDVSFPGQIWPDCYREGTEFGPPAGNIIHIDIYIYISFFFFVGEASTDICSVGYVACGARRGRQVGSQGVSLVVFVALYSARHRTTHVAVLWQGI